MSPIIDMQRRMVEAGRIRSGEKGAKGEPRRRSEWRLTSKDRKRLEEAARLWGGTVTEWEGHPGEFELGTETNELPIMLLPGQLPTTWYELWSRGGCQRRCDGQHELISDSSCLCGEERECKPYTRLSVLLPDLPGIGSWMLSSTGWNAAAELAGAADLLQRASAQGVLIPARLLLEQRVQVSGGQTRRFAVPVISIDVSFRELLGAQGVLPSTSPTRALPSGYMPIESPRALGVSIEDGLAVAETQTVTRTSRSAAPLPVIDDDIPFGDGPIAVDIESATPDRALASPGSASQASAADGVAEVLAGGPSDAPLPVAVPEEPGASPASITAAQRRRLFAIAKQHGVTDEHLRDLLREMTGSESTKELKVPDYESLVSLIESRAQMVNS